MNTRKSKLLTLIGTLTLASLGLIAFGSVRGNMTKETEATTSTIYCKVEQGWWKTDGAAVGAHTWGSPGPGTAWPGIRMEPVEGETDIWSIDIDTAKVQNIIFTRVNGSGEIADWGAKSKDQAIPTDGRNLFTITSANAVWGDPGCDGTWSVYTPPKRSGFYVTGKYGDCNWDVDNATLMDVVSEDGYAYCVKTDISLKLGDVFCVVYYNGSAKSFDWSQAYRFSKLQQEGFNYCFGVAESDDNIKCWAGGTYTIRCHNKMNEDKTIYLSSSDGKVNAEQFAAKLMSYGSADPTSSDTGACKDGRYNLCKNMYLDMAPAEKNNFQEFMNSDVSQFSNAYDRYVNWAAANGENPWTGSPVSSARIVNSIMEAENSTWIIAVVALVGLTGIGGYFFYRKRKEN